MTPYDKWRLTPPDADDHEIGTEVGQECARYHEPDEDAPRGYRPKPCTGTMFPDAGQIACDTCGELAE